MKKYNIYLADDNQFLVDILSENLEKNDQINIVGKSTNIDHLLLKVSETPIDLLLLDVNFNGTNSIDYVPKIKSMQPKICVVNLTTLNNSFIKNHATKLGVDVFLGKDECYENFDGKLIEILLGHRPENTTVKKHIVNNEAFTEHQLNIINALYKYNSEKEVADHLNISLATLKTHKQKLFLKTNSNNILELLKYGIKTGILVV